MARYGATWRSASNAVPPTSFVVLGHPDDRRVGLFQQALAGLELPAARVITYGELLAGQVALWDVVRPGAVVRIESPGKDFETERRLLVAGAAAAAGEGYERIGEGEAAGLPFERGRLRCSRQWYLGLCAALNLITAQLKHCPAHTLMADPAEIAVMFDKRACHERLNRHGTLLPPCLGPIESFDELVERMEQTGYRRVFVKLAHGSSAAGAVAYQMQGARHMATTTVEMVAQGGEVRLYNSRRLRTYREPREIAALVDALCRQRIHVEQWLPKAGIDDCTFDLRVVVIAGHARHVVVRKSRSPMTNLHLLNERGDVATVARRMGPAAWDAAQSTCERVMECFPKSLYAGIDLLVAPGYRYHAVLEVNAFGDLLPGVLSEGVDTYTAEVLAVGENPLCRPAPLDTGAGRRSVAPRPRAAARMLPLPEG